MRRLMTGLAMTALLGLAACAESTTPSETRTKNAALGATLVNPNFTATGGGWKGTGFTLDKGCGANSMFASNPSLDSWTKSALAFGRFQRTVSQTVVVPSPSTVQFGVEAFVRKDDPNAWFDVRISTKNGSASYGKQTGAAATTPQRYLVTLVTTEPNTPVTIDLIGSGSNNWKGCYGPVFRSANLLTEATPPTTTTTSTTTSTTTIPPTTTTIAQTTTTQPEVNRCNLVMTNSVLTTCESVVGFRYQWWNDSEALAPGLGRTGGQPWRIFNFATLRPPPGTTRVNVNVTLESGALTESVMLPMANPEPVTIAATLELCRLWIINSALTACELVRSFEYEWWDDTKALTSWTNESRTGQDGLKTISLGRYNPPPGATQVRILLKLTNGAKVGPLTIPFGPKARYVVIN